MSSGQASYLVQQGLGHLWTASVAGVSGISTAIKKAQKTYADYYEKEQLETLRKSGRQPWEILHQVLQKFVYLSLAGYNNEAAAAAKKAASKVAEFEKSTIPLECVTATGNLLLNFCGKYGDFSSNSWLGLSDFLNHSRMGKDHFDRDQLVTDFYFAILLLAESCGGVNAQFEHALRQAAGRLIEGSGFVASSSSSSSAMVPSVPSATSVPSVSPYNMDLLGGAVPSYAQVPSATSVRTYSTSSAAPLPAYAQVQTSTQKTQTTSFWGTSKSSSSSRSTTGSGSSSLPAYSVPSYSVPTATPAAATTANASSSGRKVSSLSADDPKTRAAKVLYVIASTIKKEAAEAEIRRQKKLVEAENMLREEQAKQRSGY